MGWKRISAGQNPVSHHMCENLLCTNLSWVTLSFICYSCAKYITRSAIEPRRNSFLRGSIGKHQKSPSPAHRRKTLLLDCQIISLCVGSDTGVEGAAKLPPPFNANFVEPLWGQTPRDG